MKMKSESRWGYGALLLTLILVVCKVFGWVDVSWFIALFPILFPLMLLFVFAVVFCLLIVFAFIFDKAPKEDENEDEDEKRRRLDAETERFVQQQRELGEKYGNPNLFILDD